jgi:uncharacterized protein (TIGR02246 family)
MDSQSTQLQSSLPTDEMEIRVLYQQLLESWNQRNAAVFAALFTNDGRSIGFDGSMLDGQAEIESSLGQIFAHHQTASYVAKVRNVRFLASNVAILHAVVGMVPPGQSDLNPAVNSIQMLTATKHGEQWRITLLQNTPAQFHGRPELVQQFTDELRQLLQ